MTSHIPILVKPIVDALIEPFEALPPDAPLYWIVDCTLGGGGHTAAFLERLASDPKLHKHKVLAVDQDPEAIERAKVRFEKELQEGRLELLRSRFGDLGSALKDKLVLAMMADLGFSSDQIEDPRRGLSFMRDGPLDMRLDPTQGQSCRDYLARVSEEELANTLFEYGEERFSRRIARVIIQARGLGELPTTTQELADLIVQAVPPPMRFKKIHAATRSFQALRIVVNQELEELDNLLRHAILSLKIGGRVAILSFHSLEDRMVKQAFKGADSIFCQLTKKPIEPGEGEIQRNPRARSAKLRIAERVR